MDDKVKEAMRILYEAFKEKKLRKIVVGQIIFEGDIYALTFQKIEFPNDEKESEN